ncbi:MAG: PIN domain-containing protein [Planctomycetota bacterium]|nr:PIN domain-containing protein [Planctomycetota bacterium]
MILDTGMLIAAERSDARIDFDRWSDQGDAFISAVTVSELLVGVHRTTNEDVRARRSAFVEALIARFPALDFTAEIARVHAEIFATLSTRGERIGAHDLLIAATALWHGHAVATTNAGEFRRVPGVTVLS